MVPGSFPLGHHTCSGLEQSAVLASQSYAVYDEEGHTLDSRVPWIEDAREPTLLNGGFAGGGVSLPSIFELRRGVTARSSGAMSAVDCER